MIFQHVAVAFLVVACSTYAAWSLMPAAARRGIAVSLLRLPLPAAIAMRLRKLAVAASGCGCDGCDRSTAVKPTAGAVQPLTFHRPAPRRPD
jgi:hypothetical protein